MVAQKTPMPQKPLLHYEEADYDELINENQEFIHNNANDDNYDVEAGAFSWLFKDLPVIIPQDKDDQKRVSSDIEDAIDDRLRTYDKALEAYAAANDDIEQEESYGPAKVWVADGRLFAKF